MWHAYFGFTNIIALAGWFTLVFLPRRPFLLSMVLYAGVGILSLVYVLGLATVLTGAVDPGGPYSTDVSFFTVEGIRAISGNDAGVVIGWTHYLAFDLFIGLWIAKDADAKGFSRVVQAVILLLVLLAGPTGLLLWLILRERAARRTARRQ
jgi:hypothetical protein